MPWISVQTNTFGTKSAWPQFNIRANDVECTTSSKFLNITEYTVHQFFF